MRSKLHATLLVGTLAAMCSAAHADTATYRLALEGVADHWAYCYWEGLSCTGILPVYSDWRGALTIQVDSSANGIFEGPDIESISLAANGGSFSYPISESGYAATISVVDGQVTSVDSFLPLWDDTVIGFSGLLVSFSDPGSHHYGPTFYSGTLTSVPEPEGLSLLASALAFAATWRLASRRSIVKG